jgi:hypothetical protein
MNLWLLGNGEGNNMFCGYFKKEDLGIYSFYSKGMMMKSVLVFIFIFLPLFCIASYSFCETSPKETIISKDDADYIFNITMDKWNADSTKMFNPLGGATKVIPLESGNGIMNFDEKTQMGLMVQHLFKDDTSPPIMLFVNTYYPVGFLPELTDEVRKAIEEASQKDLGSDYSISFSYKGQPPLKGIEMIITKGNRKN